MNKLLPTNGPARAEGLRPCPFCEGEGIEYSLVTHRDEICSCCNGSGQVVSVEIEIAAYVER